jgi:hypothetical protein
LKSVFLFSGWDALAGQVLKDHPQDVLHDDVQEKSNDDGDGDVFPEPMRTFFITATKKMKSPFFEWSDAELKTNQEAMMKELGWDKTMKNLLLSLWTKRLSRTAIPNASSLWWLQGAQWTNLPSFPAHRSLPPWSHSLPLPLSLCGNMLHCVSPAAFSVEDSNCPWCFGCPNGGPSIGTPNILNVVDGREQFAIITVAAW